MHGQGALAPHRACLGPLCQASHQLSSQRCSASLDVPGEGTRKLDAVSAGPRRTAHWPPAGCPHCPASPGRVCNSRSGLGSGSSSRATSALPKMLQRPGSDARLAEETVSGDGNAQRAVATPRWLRSSGTAPSLGGRSDLAPKVQPTRHGGRLCLNLLSQGGPAAGGLGNSCTTAGLESRCPLSPAPAQGCCMRRLAHNR